LDAGEEPLTGALREFAEEIGIALPEPHNVAVMHQDDHGGWSYWTIVLDVSERFVPPTELGWETDEARWVRAEQVAELELFDAFASTLSRLQLGGV
jgi:8-oxo-dGTP diphosphatase